MNWPTFKFQWVLVGRKLGYKLDIRMNKKKKRLAGKGYFKPIPKFDFFFNPKK
jgi:hypothetical protein